MAVPLAEHRSCFRSYTNIPDTIRYNRLTREFPDRAKALFARNEAAALDRYNHLVKLKDLYAEA